MSKPLLTRIVWALFVMALATTTVAGMLDSPMWAAILGLAAILLLITLSLWTRRREKADATWSASKVPGALTICLLMYAGLTFSYLPSHGSLLAPFHHVGIGLLVAGVVSLIWQFKEMHEFFVALASGVILDHKYLASLNSTELRKVRSKSIKALIEGATTNDDYKIVQFAEWLDLILKDDLLPGGGVGAGLYRRNMVEHVEITYLSLRQVFEELKIDIPADAACDPEMLMFREKRTTTFEVVSPSVQGNEPYSLCLSGLASDVPAIPPEHVLRIRVGRSLDDAKPVLLKVDDIEPGGTEFRGEASVPFDGGICSVYSERIEYRSGGSDNWVMNRMNTLTHGMRVEVNVFRELSPLAFEGAVIGILKPSSYQNGPRRHNGCTLNYDGWLLPDHGYFVWWWSAC